MAYDLFPIPATVTCNSPISSTLFEYVGFIHVGHLKPIEKYFNRNPDILDVKFFDPSTEEVHTGRMTALSIKKEVFFSGDRDVAEWGKYGFRDEWWFHVTFVVEEEKVDSEFPLPLPGIDMNDPEQRKKGHAIIGQVYNKLMTTPPELLTKGDSELKDIIRDYILGFTAKAQREALEEPSSNG